MTLRILNPLDWAKVEGGNVLRLNGDHGRTVKIEVNCEAPTSFHLVFDDEDGVEHRTFVGVVQGLEKIEVYAVADAYFDCTSDGEIWYCTNDNVATAVELEEATYTVPVQRKSRSEQLEHMLQIMQSGQDRLIRAQQEMMAENARLAEERDTLRASVDAAATAAAPVDGGEPSPAPAAAPAASGEAPSTPPAAATVSP